MCVLVSTTTYACVHRHMHTHTQPRTSNNHSVRSHRPSLSQVESEQQGAVPRSWCECAILSKVTDSACESQAGGWLHRGRAPGRSWRFSRAAQINGGAPPWPQGEPSMSSPHSPAQTSLCMGHSRHQFSSQGHSGAGPAPSLCGALGNAGNSEHAGPGLASAEEAKAAPSVPQLGGTLA